VLGSDDGMGQFLTPLATAHKFNGFADTYLNNGGNGGLKDLYFVAGTKLGKLGLTGVYHIFDSDVGHASDGTEFDAVVTYAATEKITILGKLAFYYGDDTGPFDRTRAIVQTQINF
jgi:hypothetical protein